MSTFFYYGGCMKFKGFIFVLCIALFAFGVFMYVDVKSKNNAIEKEKKEKVEVLENKNTPFIF